MSVEISKILDNEVPEKFRGAFSNTTASKEQDVTLAGGDSSSKAVETSTQKGEKSMNPEEIKQALKAEVQAYFDAKDSKDAQAKVEARISTLESEKTALATKVAELTSANTSLTEKVSSLEKEKTTLSDQNTAIAKERDEKEEKRAGLEKELAAIAKAKVVETRKQELSSAEILAKDEKILEKQVARISDMTDEQFKDYVEELKALATKNTKVETTPTQTAKATEKPVEQAQASVTIPQTGDAIAKAIAFAQDPSAPVDQNKVNLYAQM